MVSRLTRCSAPALALALAGCFNPASLTSEPTTDTGAAQTGTEPPPEPSTGPTPITTSEPSHTETTAPGDCGPCPTDTPYCLPSLECGDCNDLVAEDRTCADLDATTPQCDPNTGKCVECITQGDCATGTCDPVEGLCVECTTDTDCSSPTPECDPVDHTCFACDEHADCPDTACDIMKGRCFPESSTVQRYVSMDSDDPNCSKAKPCSQIHQALSLAYVSSSQYIVIHVAAATYDQAVVIVEPNRTIAILAEPGARIDTPYPVPALAVGNAMNGAPIINTSVYIANLGVSGSSTTAGMQCVNSTALWLDDLAIINHTGGPAIVSRSCQLTARRVSSIANQAGVIVGPAGSAALIDAVVAGTAGKSALGVTGGALTVLYSTIVDRQVGDSTLLACDANAMITIRNSVLFAELAASPVVCPIEIATEHSAFTTKTGLAAEDLTSLSLMEMDVGMLFKSWISSDLRLADDGGPLSGLARWHTDDPVVDITGKPRPTTDDALDVAGAYLPD